MNIYRFSVKDDQLVCLCTVNESYQEFYGENAIKILSTLKKLDYVSANISKNKIKFKVNNTMIIIENLDKMINENYFKKYLSKLVDSAKRAVTLYQLDKIKNKTFQNIKMHNKSIIAGTILVSMLVAGSSKISEDINSYNTLEEPINNEANYDIKEDTMDDVTDNLSFIEDDEILSLGIENISTGEKATYVKNTYNDMITYYSNKWGIDPKLVSAILTQESGGKNTNLMQIEFNAWKDQEIVAYNFNDNEYTTITLTDNPELHGNDVMCISESDLTNPKTNISVGTILLSYNLNYYNYNIPIAVTSYNCGTHTMNNILKTTSNSTNTSIDELINNPYNLDFLNYRYIMDSGDNEYFEHVIRYLPDYETGIQVKDDNNNIHTLSIEYKNVKTI